MKKNKFQDLYLGKQQRAMSCKPSVMRRVKDAYDEISEYGGRSPQDKIDVANIVCKILGVKFSDVVLYEKNLKYGRGA